ADALAGFFFFQAEDGIRDDLVTGVQTCALPILGNRFEQLRGFGKCERRLRDRRNRNSQCKDGKIFYAMHWPDFPDRLVRANGRRSEERRVGKGCSSRRWVEQWRAMVWEKADRVL